MTKIVCFVKTCISNRDGKCIEDTIYIRDISNRCMNCIEVAEEDKEINKEEKII